MQQSTGRQTSSDTIDSTSQRHRDTQAGIKQVSSADVESE